MEHLTLTAAEVQPERSTTYYRVVFLSLDWEAAFIGIRLRGEFDELRTFFYEGPDALALMVTLNKANLSTSSLQKRVLTRLIADGKLAGTVTGVPD